MSRVHGPPRPSISWRTIAVTAAEPVQFAKELESGLSELTSNGYSITSQFLRGNAVILTGQRLEGPVPEYPPPGTPPVGNPFSSQRRVVQQQRAAQAPPHATHSEEVLYHFSENGQKQQRAFPTLVEALRLVKEHLAGDVLPISIVRVSMWQHDPACFPGLLEAYKEELSSEKQLG